jgi:hypothetical protein
MLKMIWEDDFVQKLGSGARVTRDGDVVAEIGDEPRVDVRVCEQQPDEEEEAPPPKRARLPTWETFADVLAHCNDQLGFACKWSPKNKDRPEDCSPSKKEKREFVCGFVDADGWECATEQEIGLESVWGSVRRGEHPLECAKFYHDARNTVAWLRATPKIDLKAYFPANADLRRITRGCTEPFMLKCPACGERKRQAPTFFFSGRPCWNAKCPTRKLRLADHPMAYLLEEVPDGVTWGSERRVRVKCPDGCCVPFERRVQHLALGCYSAWTHHGGSKSCGCDRCLQTSLAGVLDRTKNVLPEPLDARTIGHRASQIIKVRHAPCAHEREMKVKELQAFSCPFVTCGGTIFCGCESCTGLSLCLPKDIEWNDKADITRIAPNCSTKYRVRCKACQHEWCDARPVSMNGAPSPTISRQAMAARSAQSATRRARF